MPIDIIHNIEKGVLPNTATTQLFLMDVEKFLDALPMQPIFDLVVTSPPYNIGKEYENQVPLSDYYDWQKRIIEKIYPRLKDNGSISLHKVCQYAIYLDRSFNAAHYMQSEDRIHRLGLSPDAKPQIEFVECEDSIDQVVRTRLELKVKTMAQALEDSSLSVEISSVDYDEEAEDYDSLTADDAKAVIEYFFSGDQND